MALEREMATYQANLASLISHEGKFVLVKGDKIEGIFDSYNDALKSAYEKFGVEAFLVKQISSIESISYFTREIGPICHTSHFNSPQVAQ
jgi:hypothetical protein